jgi:predicted Zn finger-like uncharacterized protein
MSGVTRCPSCSSALRLADELLGREVKCPRCANVFTASEDRPAAPAARREEEASVPPTAVRRRHDDRDEHDLPRFRRRDLDDEEDDDHPYVRRGGRGYALARVQGPGILLQIYGIFWVLVGGALVLLAVYGAIQLQGPLPPAEKEDAIVMTAVGGICSVLGFVLGTVIWWGGTRMKALRTYGLALTATILTFLVALLACAMLAVVGIWPLVVLCDSAVREEFD